VQIEQVIKECLEGNAGAWEMLVNTYSKRVFNLAYQFAGSYQEAEDLTQEIFLKLSNSLSKYDFEKNFTAWLVTLSKNYLIDEYRRTKWEKKNRDEFDDHLISAALSDGPEASLIKEENRKMIWKGLNLLSSHIRMAIILRDIQGKGYEEIAEILNLPLGTVKSRVSRGRLQLAKILQNRKESRDEM
jgi:RNA polymerase sigma-70 factor (ECF subfamily)